MKKTLLILISFFLYCFPLTCCHALINSELSHHISNAQPGKTYLSKITLNNDDDEPVEVHLSQADYTFNEKGENFYLESGSSPRSNANWIELKDRIISLPPKSQKDIFYTIKIPESMQETGSFWSLIFIEPQKNYQPKEPQAEGFKLTLKIRYAYQVITTFEGGKANLHVASYDVCSDKEKTTLKVVIKNNGTIFLKPVISLKIFDEKGALVAEHSLKEERLFPETAISVLQDISTLPPKNYTGLILMDDNDHQLFGKRFSLTIP